MGAPLGNKNASKGGSKKSKSQYKVSKRAGSILMKSGSVAKGKERQKFWIKAAKKRKK